jgi:hypothetical protein
MIMATRTGHIPPVAKKPFMALPSSGRVGFFINEQRNSRESLQ